MSTKPVKIPGPDHPITIEHNPKRVVVKIADRVIADTKSALALKEASYPVVQYIPRKDVDMSLLERTDHTTYCPYKGDVRTTAFPLGGARAVNAVWSYEAPYAAVAEIKDYVAFYPDRVDSIESAEPYLPSISWMRAEMSAAILSASANCGESSPYLRSISAA